MQLTKQQKCILMRNGVTIWLDQEQSQDIETVLTAIKQSTFIKIQGRIINTADCSGVYLPEDMENYNRVRNGQWQDIRGEWHDKNDKIRNEDVIINNILNK